MHGFGECVACSLVQLLASRHKMYGFDRIVTKLVLKMMVTVLLAALVLVGGKPHDRTEILLMCTEGRIARRNRTTLSPQG